MRAHILTLLLAATVISPWLTILPTANADVIDLKDGRSFSGSLSRQDGSVLIQTDDGARITAAPSDILRVTLTSHLSPQEAANTEWTRTAALIRQASDLPTILSLHQKFIDKFPQPELSAGVRASLVQYQKLAAQSGVKFRGRWMPAAQVQVTLRQWQDKATPALALYNAGKLRPALENAKKVLDQDADNPNAAAIAGLAAFRLNNSKAAESYFTTLAAQDSSSVLAENNLAVILFQQGRQAESLLHYTRALQAKPDNRLVADNIEEALAAYAGKADALPYRDLLRQFQQVEIRLESAMAQKGLYRYGSTWVTLPQLQALKSNLQTIKYAMAQLDARVQSTQNDGSALDSQLQKTIDDYNTTLASVDYLNSTLANSGWDPGLMARRDALLADLDKLRLRRADLQARRASLTASAPNFSAESEKLKTAFEAAQHAQYTGVQRIMDFGEDENPPPPTVFSMPAPYVPPAPPVIVQQNIVPPVPVEPIYNPYAQFATLGVTPWVPIFIVPPRSHDHSHGDNPRDNHGDDHVPSPTITIYPVTLPVPPVSPFTVQAQPKP